MCKSDHEAEIIKRDYGTLVFGKGATAQTLAEATVLESLVTDTLSRFTPLEESETFTCWKCEDEFPEDEKFPYGLEWVCEGCDEG